MRRMDADTARRYARTFAHALLDLLFPPQCVGCRAKLPVRDVREIICEACLAAIPLATGFFCPACGRRLYEPRASCHSFSYALAAATSYENNAARELIHALKYGRARSAAPVLAGLLARYLVPLLPTLGGELKNAVLIPLPLHRRRERERGFNQSVLIALALREREPWRKIPLASGALIRTRATATQTKCKSGEARTENVRGSFAVGNPARIAGKHVFLLDDVATSGATLAEAARALKAAGAASVIGVVVAKA